MEMNLPTFSSDLTLIKNALSQKTDIRYKGKVVSEVETEEEEEDVSRAFPGEFHSGILTTSHTCR